MDKQMKLISLSEIELQEVEWLWYPYIPFGKITIIQGDPGEGKTTLGLRLAAACSNGSGFPGMEEREPISVIYQTAEDGLGDTVKPRLMEAEANENLIFNISEETDVLTLKDERIEAAIKATNARLMIFDPIQGYVGEDTDINRANEIRTVMRGIARIAEEKEYTDYVCVDALGKLYDPDFVTGHFGQLLKKHNLKKIRFHDLRHSCASVLLAQGVPMKQIQEWLGHSDMSTTANIYSHLDAVTKADTGAAMSKALG